MIEVRISVCAINFSNLKIAEVISYPLLGNQDKFQEKQGSVNPRDEGGAGKRRK